jgi:hypothetical protein
MRNRALGQGQVATGPVPQISLVAVEGSTVPLPAA